jgi:hypothetical protein
MDDRSAGWLARVRDVHAVNGGPSGCSPAAIGARTRRFSRCTARAKHHSGEQESCQCCNLHWHAANHRRAPCGCVALQPEPQHSAKTPRRGDDQRSRRRPPHRFPPSKRRGNHSEWLGKDLIIRRCQPHPVTKPTLLTTIVLLVLTVLY